MPAQLRYPGDERLLRVIYCDLYLRSFPRREEREDWEDWRLLFGDGGHGRMLVLGWGLDAGEPRIAGFASVEFYPESCCGLLSYIAVEPEFRRRGYGRELVARSGTILKEQATSAGAPLRAVFAEIYDPGSHVNDDVLDSEHRVSFFAQLGARRVPISYIQPDLGHGFGPARLWLVVLPTGDPVANVVGEDVRAFVRGVYAAHRGSSVRQLRQMEGELPDGRLCLESLRPLEFGKYAVALHFVLHRPDGTAQLPESTVEFASFDQDMLAYAYRDQPPFSNTHHPVPEELRSLRLRFSPEVSFVSEGSAYTLVERHQRFREVRLRASVTHFKGAEVCHLTLTPSDSASASLTEYDLIRIIKLWQRSEQLEGGFKDGGADTWIRFGTHGQEPDLSMSELARRVFADQADRPAATAAPWLPRAGTVELLTTGMKAPPDWELVWGAVKRLECAGDDAPRPDVLVQDAVEAVAGVFQGLLDFREIDEEELSDVFDGAKLDRHGLTGLHKGTVLSVLDEDRPLEVGLGSFGASPYLIAAHAVLVNNEAVLGAARAAADGKGQRQRQGGSWLGRQELTSLQHQKAALHELLDREYVANVFHYPSERWLYERGHESRGLREREKETRTQLAETEARCEIASERRRRTADDARNALLLVLSFISLHAIIHGRGEDWILLAVLVLLAVGYWRLRE